MRPCARPLQRRRDPGQPLRQIAIGAPDGAGEQHEQEERARHAAADRRELCGARQRRAADLFPQGGRVELARGRRGRDRRGGAHGLQGCERGGLARRCGCRGYRRWRRVGRDRRQGNALVRGHGLVRRALAVGVEIEGERVVERGIELVDHVAHVRGALVRVLRQHGAHEVRQLRRNLLHRHERRYRFFLHPLCIEVRVVRRVARQQFVGERAQAVDVIGGSRRLPAQLLGARGKGRQAPHHRIRARIERAARDAEVGELHAAALVEQHIAGLKVAVDDTALVGVLQGACDLDQHRHDREVARAAQALEVPALRQLHGQQERRAFALRRKHFQDPVMIEAARTLVLVHERHPGGGAAPGRRVQDLQGHVGVGFRVERAPHLALPADAESLAQKEAGLQGLPVGCRRVVHGLILSGRTGRSAKIMSSPRTGSGAVGISFVVCHRPAGGDRSVRRSPASSEAQA